MKLLLSSSVAVGLAIAIAGCSHSDSNAAAANGATCTVVARSGGGVPDQCANGSQCGIGQSCVDADGGSRCAPGCRDDSQCSAGEVCDVTAATMPEGDQSLGACRAARANETTLCTFSKGQCTDLDINSGYFYHACRPVNCGGPMEPSCTDVVMCRIGQHCTPAGACASGCSSGDDCDVGEACDTSNGSPGLCRRPVSSDYHVCPPHPPGGCCVMDGTYRFVPGPNAAPECASAFAASTCKVSADPSTCMLRVSCDADSPDLRGGRVGDGGSYSYAIGDVTCQVQFWQSIPRFDVMCTGVAGKVSCSATATKLP
jgi:hypothetical protein